MSQRTWWAEQWPEGEQYVAGLVAQDVQDALFETVGRWPCASSCDGPRALALHPARPRRPDPMWVCEESGQAVAPLGHLWPAAGRGGTKSRHEAVGQRSGLRTELNAQRVLVGR